jgi:hypothetical protein
MHDPATQTSENSVTTKFAEHPFYELQCIAFSLSCFGMTDTLGTRAMGPALLS